MKAIQVYDPFLFKSFSSALRGDLEAGGTSFGQQYEQIVLKVRDKLQIPTAMELNLRSGGDFEFADVATRGGRDKIILYSVKCSSKVDYEYLEIKQGTFEKGMRSFADRGKTSTLYFQPGLITGYPSLELTKDNEYKALGVACNIYSPGEGAPVVEYIKNPDNPANPKMTLGTFVGGVFQPSGDLNVYLSFGGFVTDRNSKYTTPKKIASYSNFNKKLFNDAGVTANFGIVLNVGDEEIVSRYTGKRLVGLQRYILNTLKLGIKKLYHSGMTKEKQKTWALQAYNSVVALVSARTREINKALTQFPGKELPPEAIVNLTTLHNIAGFAIESGDLPAIALAVSDMQAELDRLRVQPGQTGFNESLQMYAGPDLGEEDLFADQNSDLEMSDLQRKYYIVLEEVINLIFDNAEKMVSKASSREEVKNYLASAFGEIPVPGSDSSYNMIDRDLESGTLMSLSSDEDDDPAIDLEVDDTAVELDNVISLDLPASGIDKDLEDESEDDPAIDQRAIAESLLSVNRFLRLAGIDKK